MIIVTLTSYVIFKKTNSGLINYTVNIPAMVICKDIKEVVEVLVSLSSR